MAEEDYITMKRSTGFVVVCLIGIFMLLLLILDRTYINSMLINANISSNKNVMVKNNIQAPHTYNKSIKNIDGYKCIDVDNIGTLLGSSMQPTLFEGNTILLKKYNSSVILHSGDIIRYFRFNDMYSNCTDINNTENNITNLQTTQIYLDNAIVHRINTIYNDEIIVEGDNLNEIESIDRCQILGVAIGVIYT